MLGELSQKYPAESTENANAEEKTVSREELVKNVNKAQDAYDIAEEEYNASKTLVESYKAEMDSYAASRNGTTWHDRQDAWQKKYDEARGDLILQMAYGRLMRFCCFAIIEEAAG